MASDRFVDDLFVSVANAFRLRGAIPWTRVDKPIMQNTTAALLGCTPGVRVYEIFLVSDNGLGNGLARSHWMKDLR